MATKDVYVLTSKRAPWRRAGFVFESRTKPITVDADQLTGDQLKKLNDDPAIKVVKTTVDDTPSSPTPFIDAVAAALIKSTDAPPASDAAATGAAQAEAEVQTASDPAPAAETKPVETNTATDAPPADAAKGAAADSAPPPPPAADGSKSAKSSTAKS